MRATRLRLYIIAAACTIMVTSAATSQPAHADNCAWARDKLHQYLAQCAGVDDCRNETRMRGLTEKSCGPSLEVPRPALKPSAAAGRTVLPPRTKGPVDSSEDSLSRHEIQDVQRALAALGLAPGAADGLPGPRTRRAVRAFQEENGLAPDGKLTDDLVAALAAALAEKARAAKEDDANEACAQLAGYRDGALFQDWEHAMRRHRVSADNVAHLADLRREIESDASWVDYAYAGGLVLQISRTLGDIVAAAVGVNKPTQMVTQKLAVRRLQAGAAAVTLVQSGAEAAAYEAVLSFVPAAKGVYDTISNVNTLIQINGNYQGAKGATRNALQTLDREIAQYHDRLEQAAQMAGAAHHVKAAIDELCGGRAA